MCVIVAKPSGVKIDLDTLKACWDTNSDGAGVAYALDNRVHIYKGIMEWDDFRAMFLTSAVWTDLAAIFHFRIRTHGATDEGNTHPFEVIPGKLAFAHNGVMSSMTRKARPDLSDTQCFNRYILQQLPHNFMRNQGIVELICHAIGNRNKLAFIDHTGQIDIFNKDQGKEEESGLWFSNTNHVKKVYSGYNTGWRSHEAGFGGSRAYGGYPWAPTTPHWEAPSPPKPTYPQNVVPSSVLPKPVPVTAISVIEDDTDDGLDFIDDDLEFGDNGDEWYCHDCAQWFDEDDILFADDWSDPIPTCPSCGTNAMVTWGASDAPLKNNSAKARN